MDASYLTQQVNNIIGQLHGLFDDMGVPSHERESREAELFAVLSETLTSHVRAVASEKDEMIERAQNTIAAIRQMEASIRDDEDDHDHTSRRDGDELRVTFPLSRCQQKLNEKHAQVNRLYRERYEQVKKLAQALESYSSHLEPNFVRITLPPNSGGQASPPPSFDVSHVYVEQLDKEFTRVYEEYARRVSTVQSLAGSIIGLWAELGTPQAQTEPTISKYYRDAPEQLGLHEGDIDRLRVRRDKLAAEKRNREKRLAELRAAVEALWQKLGVGEADQKAFLNANRGCGLRQVNEFEDELARLDELKRQNLHLFVEDTRYRLQELWDALYLSEDEMLEFTPAFSDVYSDALLEVHERELARLEVLKDQRMPILTLVEKYRALVAEREELAASTQDASRLMGRGQKGEKRDPGKLLREEKSRKRIAKELPRVAADLQKVLEEWEAEFGRPFLVHGERYLNILGDEQAAAKTPGPRSKTPSGLRSATATLGRANSTACTSVSKPMAPPNRGLTRTPTAPTGRLGRSATVSMPSGTTPHGSTTSLVAPSTPSLGNGPGNGPSNGAMAIANSKGSPIRLANRVPLTALNNSASSPERQRQDPPRPASSSSVSRPPPLFRAPPPKIRDLATVPELPRPSNPYKTAGLGSNSSVNLVRPTSPDDVFDDRSRDVRHGRSKAAFSASQRRYAPSSTAMPDYDHRDEHDWDRDRDLVHLQSKSAMASSLSVHSNHSHRSLVHDQSSFARSQRGYHDNNINSNHRSSRHNSHSSDRDRDSSQTDFTRSDTAMSTLYPARHTSNSNSSHSTVMSGSENWETYEDDSEPELDASDTYFAKVRAARSKMAEQQHQIPPPSQQQQQQAANGAPTPAGLGMSHANVKLYGQRPMPSHAGHGTVDAEGNRIISGSEWADEDEAI